MTRLYNNRHVWDTQNFGGLGDFEDEQGVVTTGVGKALTELVQLSF